ncbi:carbohydrate kinase [Shimia sp.]|uniref:carbohydrate kinase family protein n=1 Tax=Shimia sp. TaxID=1954381 RepID=UPI0032999DED
MILCCGEALIDMIPAATDTGRDGFVPHSGGAVFNTAIALGRLGVPAGMLTGLSEDTFGHQLTESLRASHVNTSLVIRSQRPTTLAFVHLLNGHATYTFFDENSAGRMLSVEDLPEITDEVSTLYFGGISLACEPGADTYAALLEREGANRVVMIDPNIRPGFVNDLGRYRDRLDRMIARADIVKVSDEDVNWIIAEPLSLDEKVALILEKGPAVVILTRGSEGSMAFLPGGRSVSAPANMVEVVDTVGAGDTFNAGVLAQLFKTGGLSKSGIRELSPEAFQEALVNGAKVSSVTVSRAGANPPWADEI